MEVEFKNFDRSNLDHALAFSEALEITKRSFTESPEALDSDDDEAKEDLAKDTNHDILKNVEVLDKPTTKDSSIQSSIALNRPKRDCSVKSQKSISNYFRKK